jgi:hypothetical protein
MREVHVSQFHAMKDYVIAHHTARVQTEITASQVDVTQRFIQR